MGISITPVTPVFGALVTGVDKECLTGASAKPLVLLVAGQEPEANGNLCRVEELPRQGDHAVDQVGFDQDAADFSVLEQDIVGPLQGA